MGYIFYGFGVLILLSRIMAIVQFKKIFFVKEWFVKFKEVTGDVPKASDFRSKDDLTLHTNQNILTTLELMWVFAGLLTNNWPIFLIIFLISVMLKVIFGSVKYTLMGKIISMKFLIFRVVLYSLMIVNKFCPHLDLINQSF